ncbi:MAG: lysophospholipase [Flaviaesturariibacter sp.]|nr:lysophospholipase [Flaviaesturariibacter sp.]
MEKLYTYLALGDSYTVGESVPLRQSFPYQVVENLRKGKLHVAAPEIVARTGWTTDELSAAIADHRFLDHYDLVTLLIGVNNQYRGRRIEEFNIELEALLNRAVELAGGKREHVLLLSIPDYGVTPFAKKLDASRIATEIDQYNVVKRALATQYKVSFVDITESTRNAYTDESLVADDGLHPSAKEYKGWAVKVAEMAKTILK